RPGPQARLHLRTTRAAGHELVQRTAAPLALAGKNSPRQTDVDRGAASRRQAVRGARHRGRVSTWALGAKEDWPPREATAQAEVDSSVQTPPPGPPLKVGEDVDVAGKARGAVPSPPDPPADGGHSVTLICDSWQAEDMFAPRLRMLGANQERIVTFSEVD